MPIFPPELRGALCSWSVQDCLSQFDSSAPLLTIIPRCCCAFIFVFVFLEPLPSVPVSVGYTNPFCWLPDPILVPTQSQKQLCAVAIHVDSPATSGDTDTRGNECSHPAPAQASHPPHALGNPALGPFIHQHLPESLQQTSQSQSQR